MSFNDCKISESEIQTTGVQSQADTLTGSAADNKMVFDALPTLVIQKLNSLIDQMQQNAAAGQIGVTPFDGMTAQTLQAALEQIQADIGGNYGGADGAGKVGYTPSEGVDEDTVQAAIEAVQANLTAYIAKIKAATGAEEVGNAPIAGMTATNVQQALEELRNDISDIVAGIIPGGSITSDMLQDGAVTADKLGSDVTGDTIPTSASDPTSISSQLSNRLLKSGDTMMGDLLLGAPTMGTHGAIGAFVDDVSAVTFIDAFDASRDNGSRIQLVTNRADVNSCYIQLLKRVDGEFILLGELALAIKPQEFSLPLAEGVTTVGACYKNIYSKDQFGIVRVWFSVHFESIPASGTHVFNLPEGFRPDSACCAAAVLSMAEYYNAIVTIHPSGDALVDHGTIGQSGPINLHRFIEFPAAS